MNHGHDVGPCLVNLAVNESFRIQLDIFRIRNDIAVEIKLEMLPACSTSSGALARAIR